LKKDEVEENEKLRKTERAINKSTIIIHSCLHFIVSTTSFTQKINNVYALFTRHYCCHLHQLHIIYTIYNVIYLLVFAHPGLAPPQIGESVSAQPIAAFPVHK